MPLLHLLIILLTGLLISGESHAMEMQNPNVVKVQCDILKHTDGLSFFTFSGAFVKYLQGTRNIGNAVTLQCSVTQRPTVTINPIDSLITIECGFKDVATQQRITVREDIPLCSQTVTRSLSDDWQITIITSLPTGDNPYR